jgi:hypothetical protein
MKGSVFWVITSCSPLKANRRFGGKCNLHFQGRRICQACSTCHMLSSWFLSGLFFNPEDGNMFLRNVGWLSTDYRRYIPEDRTLHNHGCENLKSCKCTDNFTRTLLLLTSNLYGSYANGSSLKLSYITTHVPEYTYFNPEDGGGISLRNVGICSQIFNASQHKIISVMDARKPKLFCLVAELSLLNWPFNDAVT